MTAFATSLSRSIVLRETQARHVLVVLAQSQEFVLCELGWMLELRQTARKGGTCAQEAVVRGEIVPVQEDPLTLPIDTTASAPEAAVSGLSDRISEIARFGVQAMQIADQRRDICAAKAERRYNPQMAAYTTRVSETRDGIDSIRSMISTLPEQAAGLPW